MKPVRYNTDDDQPEAVYVHENGYLVKWDDYAALAAENERLQGNLAGRDAMIMGRDSIIKCRDEEIQRLRKLLEMYLKADPLIGEAVASAMLAAKEEDRK